MITGTLDDGRLNLWRSNDKLARWMLLYLLAQISVPLAGVLRDPVLTYYSFLLLVLCVPASARSIDGASYRGVRVRGVSKGISCLPGVPRGMVPHCISGHGLPNGKPTLAAGQNAKVDNELPRRSYKS